jgi:hypothetical protein
MCPACIASTAVMVAGAVSTGGILAVCIGKFRKLFRADRLGLFQKASRSRDHGYPSPPPRIRTSGIAASGSYLR